MGNVDGEKSGNSIEEQDKALSECERQLEEYLKKKGIADARAVFFDPLDWTPGVSKGNPRFYLSQRGGNPNEWRSWIAKTSKVLGQSPDGQLPEIEVLRRGNELLVTLNDCERILAPENPAMIQRAEIAGKIRKIRAAKSRKG